MNARILALLLLLGSSGCQTMASLGRVLEGAAYPAGGAVAGGALGGPVGAVGGAAAGDILGQAVTQQGASQAAQGAVVREVFLEPTVEAFFWMSFFGIPMWAWLLICAYVLHRAPWLPGYIVDKFKSTTREGPDAEEDPQAHRSRSR